MSLTQQRIDRLERLMYQLECSDDSLFTNINGNLPLYQQWKDELRTLRGQKCS